MDDLTGKYWVKVEDIDSFGRLLDSYARAVEQMKELKADFDKFLARQEELFDHGSFKIDNPKTNQGMLVRALGTTVSFSDDIDAIMNKMMGKVLMDLFEIRGNVGVMAAGSVGRENGPEDALVAAWPIMGSVRPDLYLVVCLTATANWMVYFFQGQIAKWLNPDNFGWEEERLKTTSKDLPFEWVYSAGEKKVMARIKLVPSLSHFLAFFQLAKHIGIVQNPLEK